AEPRWASSLALPSAPRSASTQPLRRRCLHPTPRSGAVASATGLSVGRGGSCVKVHLVDGTYELFRQHFGRPDPGPYGATRGVLRSVLTLLDEGATHIGVATDHVIESFRNDLWPGYKTSEGMPPELLA